MVVIIVLFIDTKRNYHFQNSCHGMYSGWTSVEIWTWAYSRAKKRESQKKGTKRRIWRLESTNQKPSFWRQRRVCGKL